MKTSKPLQLLFALFLLVLPSLGQAELSGSVVRVVDGRTFVFETDRGNISAMVQYVDVPEPQQPLSGLIHSHLERLIGGKVVRFQPNGFSPNALVGKVYLGRVDVGLQLIRDGAAWHIPVGRSGQDPDEALIYEGHQRLAENERRGIWSIIGITPAWEFRAQKDRGGRDISFPRAVSAGAKEARNYETSRADVDMWIEVGGMAFAQINPSGRLFWGYDPDKKLRNTSTSSVAQIITKGQMRLEAEVRVIYFQGEIKPRAASTAFILTLLATSGEHTFSDEDQLTLDADGEAISTAKGQRFWRENAYGVQEMMQFRIGRTDLAKIANAKKVSIAAGLFTGSISRDLQAVIRDLLEIAG